jgi:carbamoyltransferase
MYWGFPTLSIPETLRIAGVDPKDVELVAIAGTSSTRAKPLEFGYESVGFFRTFFAELSATPLTGLLMGTDIGTKASRKVFETSIFRGTAAIESVLKEIGIAAPLEFVDHHLCHAASAYFTSGWNECLSLTLDGSGDGYCSRVYECRDGRMRLINSIPAYHSPGFYYCYVTHLLGFIALRHEGKVTGLAAFGNPDKTREIFARRIGYDSKKFSFVNRGGWLQAELRVLDRLLKPFSREDIAAGIQSYFEDIVARFAVDAVQKSGARNIALSGGVFSNVRLNQEVWDKTKAEDVFVFPNMGDGGLAAGAAFDAYARRRADYRPYRLSDVYVGSDFADAEMERSIRNSDLPYKRVDRVESAVAKLLADGKIVARFNGRMEYGPRALGNRSILYHCGDRSVNQWLNEQLNRTEFMPFAPVMLKEDATEYLVNYRPERSFAAEFMTITYHVTPKCRDQAPAITHVDSTARPQIVTEAINPSYYHIVKEYKKLTGLSVLVNTSFNMHEEPIVRTPEEALKAFVQSRIHALAMGPFLIEMDWGKRA